MAEAQKHESTIKMLKERLAGLSSKGDDSVVAEEEEEEVDDDVIGIEDVDRALSFGSMTGLGGGG